MGRALIISDTHIGDLRFKDNQHVIQLLKSEQFDRLVLNGDIVDLWVKTFDEVVFDPLFKYIAQISITKPVVWILGNHDADIIHHIGCQEMGNIKIDDQLLINECGKSILVLHGHQVYSYIGGYWLMRKLAYLNHIIYKYTSIDIQGTIIEPNSNLAKLKRFDVIKRFGGVSTIIMAHTHMIGWASYNKTTLLDIGSACKTRSYGIIENGVVSLKIMPGSTNNSY